MGNANVRKKGGWSQREEQMLFEQAKEALGRGLPVKSVFDRIAEETGRRPNSIRNFYYLKLKENSEIQKTGFVPFSEEEVEALLFAMLQGQAQGKSVRSIAMELGKEDKKAMLRYQNKYRSLLRNDPEKIRGAMEDLRSRGLPCADPFTTRRKKKPDLPSAMAELLKNLPLVGEEAENLVLILGDLVRHAAETTLEDTARRKNADLEQQLCELRGINRRFLSLSGMERLSGLGDYILALENSAALRPQ